MIKIIRENLNALCVETFIHPPPSILTLFIAVVRHTAANLNTAHILALSHEQFSKSWREPRRGLQYKVTRVIFLGPKSDHCLAMSETSLFETWLICPWCIKMAHLMLSISWGGRHLCWCRNKTKSMLLKPKQNKGPVFDSGTKESRCEKRKAYFGAGFSHLAKLCGFSWDLLNVLVSEVGKTYFILKLDWFA